MKRVLTIFLLTLTMSLCLIFTTACIINEKPKVYFIADNEIELVVESTGMQKITPPENPTKEGYTFEGWYFDSNVWENEYEEGYFADKAIEADVYVYAKFNKIELPPEHEHEYTSAVQEPTCTENGKTTYTCQCGDSYFETIDALGHTEEILPAVKPTCTEKGLTEGKKCKVCKVITVHQQDINAGHSYSETVKQPTCTEQGYVVKACSGCGHNYIDRYLTALGHIEQTLKGYEATCTEKGLTDGKICSVCKIVLQTQTPIDVLGHTYAEKVIAPTCTTKGYTENKCSCGEFYLNNYVNALGHTEQILVSKQPTCTEKGLTEGKKCSVCQVILLAQQEVDATGHDHVSYTTPATCIKAGKTTYTCHCGDTYSQTIPKVSHTQAIKEGVAPTCTKTGLSQGKYCSVCQEILVEQEILNALGHNYTSQTVQATCTIQGHVKHTCKTCGDVIKSDFTSELGHLFTTYQSLGNGKEKATCDRSCGATDERDIGKITVIFNTNGGSAVSLKQYDYGAKYGELPTTTREGYTFLGWYDSISNGNKIKETDVITDNHAIFAYWQAIELTITFNANTGSVSPTSKTVVYDSLYGDLPTPTKSGYRFLGWFTSATGGTQITSSNVVKATINQTLYAQWKEIIMYTINYNSNGGSAVESVQLENDLPYGEMPTPTKTGYNFTGWYTAENGGSKVETTDLVLGSTTLYARWEGKRIIVSFAQTGRTIVDPKEVVFGTAYGTLMVPEKYGYDFLGWFTEAEGGVRVNEGTLIVSGENHTLYGHWQGKTYTVYFNANGGSVSPTFMQLTNGNPYGNMPVPTLTGYVFLGWYTQAQGGGKITASTSVELTADQTLYAHWTENANATTITFKQEGQTDIVVGAIKGEKFDKSTVPEITQKTGYNAEWQINGVKADFNNLIVSDNLVITLVYTAKQYVLTFKYDYVNGQGQNPSVAGLTSMTITYGAPYVLPALSGTNYHQASGWMINGTLFTESMLTGDSWNVDCSSETVAYLQGAKVKYTFKQEGKEDVIKYYDYGSVIDTATFPEVQGLTDNQVGGWEKESLYNGILATRDRVINAVIVEKDFSPSV